MGHALTLTRPVRMRQHDERRFSVAGTPTDSVTMGLRKVLPGPPDVILSGVNRGANLADDITYSGTVSAAMEGTLAGIRSIAMSQVMSDYTVGRESFAPAEAVGAEVIRKIVAADWGAGVLVNINFPPVDRPVGVRVTEQGFRDYGHIRIDARVDPRGFPYYWFGYGKEKTAAGHETDLKAMHEGCISVTPLHLDLTHYPTLNALRAAMADITETDRPA